MRVPVRKPRLPPPGGLWPTDQQLLLLRMSLGLEQDLNTAFDQWCQSTQQNNLDPGSFRLLPLLAHQLHKVDIDTSVIPDLDRLSKSTWLDNWKNTNTFLAVHECLAAAGVPCVVLKGMALTLDGTYASKSLRPSADVDVLIKPLQLDRALAALQKDGWVLVDKQSDFSANELIDILHSATLVKEGLADLDLHWSIYYHYGKVIPEHEYLWDEVQAVAVNTSQIWTLSNVEQLLHTCCHGARWADDQPIRWLADCHLLLARHQTTLDWDLLIKRSDELNISTRVRQTLEYLKLNLESEIPSDVIERLSKIKIDIIESLENKIHSRPNGVFQGYPQRLCRLARMIQNSYPNKFSRIRQTPYFIKILLSIPSNTSLGKGIVGKFSKLMVKSN